MTSWNNDFKSIKKRGMLFKDWCTINHYEYMLDELDEDYLRLEYDKDLSELTHGFDKKLRFVCKNGHEFFAKPVHRTNGQMLICPYCKGSRLSLNEHSVAIDLYHLMDEWDYERNTVSPDEITSSSVKKVWWICPEGHSYQSTPHHRKEGKGCPYCVNLKVMIGENDLFTTNPELKNEWDFERNKLDPASCVRGTQKKVWWKCDKGHSWEANIVDRVHGRGCPYCSRRSTSFAEQAIYFYLNFLFTDAVNRDRIEGYEFDISLKEERIVLEYNGYAWHKDKAEWDKKKFLHAQSMGYYPIVVESVRDSREFVSEITETYARFKCYSEKSDSNSITFLVRNVIYAISLRLGFQICPYELVDIDQDFGLIELLIRGEFLPVYYDILLQRLTTLRGEYPESTEIDAE